VEVGAGMLKRSRHEDTQSLDRGALNFQTPASTKTGSSEMSSKSKKGKTRKKTRKTRKPQRPARTFTLPRSFTTPRRGTPKFRRKAGVNMGRKGKMFEKKVSPPSNEGWVMSSGMAATFFPVEDPGCSGIRISCKLGQVQNSTTGVVGVTLAGTTVSGGFPMAPAYTLYYPAAVADYCGLFERYMVVRHRMIYVPACASTTPGMWGMAYFDDPRNAFIVCGITNDNHAVDTNTLNSRADLKEGPVQGTRIYSQWYKPAPGQDMRYVNGANNSIDGNVGWTTADVATLRDQVQGAYVFYCTNLTASTIFGDLFIEMEIVLCGLQGLAYSAPALVQKQTERSMVLDNLHVLLPIIRELTIGTPFEVKDSEKEKDTTPDPMNVTRKHLRQERRSKSAEKRAGEQTPRLQNEPLFKM